MAEYQFQGVDRAGKKVNGKLEAPNEGELRIILRGQGVRPVRIVKTGAAAKGDITAMFKPKSGAAITLNLEQQLTFTRQLQVLISAGVPLVQGLEILLDQITDRALREIVAGLRDKVSGGTYLWEALSGYPRAFPKLYLALIRAGESSGSIDAML